MTRPSARSPAAGPTPLRREQDPDPHEANLPVERPEASFHPRRLAAKPLPLGLVAADRPLKPAHVRVELPQHKTQPISTRGPNSRMRHQTLGLSLSPDSDRLIEQTSDTVATPTRIRKTGASY